MYFTVDTQSSVQGPIELYESEIVCAHFQWIRCHNNISSLFHYPYSHHAYEQQQQQQQTEKGN